MKTTRITLSAILILLTVSVAFPQGRGNGGKHSHSNKHDREWNDNTRIREYYYEGDRYSRRGDHYHHYYVSPWMKRHHPQMKTRYVYFRDYNVYYDYHRNVYMTLSGRNWVFTAELPLAMRRVDPHRIIYVDVDYVADDLYGYHVQRHKHDRWYYCSR